MGIPGIFKEIGQGERIALSRLAIEHLEKTRRPLRVAIDVAIWQFQNQSGQGGKNPALRVFFYRLLKLLALPIQPVFVYDGKNKPLTKRNKSVMSYGTCIQNELSKPLLQVFRFPHHTAPGEAEAECALLQKRGIVDAVMSQDSDAIMFGSNLTLRNWTSESSSKGSNTSTHVDIHQLNNLRANKKLDPDGLILVALLSGADYNTDGVANFGIALSCEIARAGFGTELLELIREENINGLQEWRERLQYELETNESGFFKSRHMTVKIPESFPDRRILKYYTSPAVSSEEDLTKLQSKWSETWDQDIDVLALRKYVGATLDWLYKPGAKKLTRCLAPALLAHRLRRGLDNTTLTSSDQIKIRRQDFSSDGIPELRVEVVPADIVGLDINSEEESQNLTESLLEDYKHRLNEEEIESLPPSRSIKRKTPLWDPLMPEKYWIHETIMQLGVPTLVEEWQDKQRDVRADPKKFAARNCAHAKVPKKVIDKEMKAGSLDVFFTTSKPTTTNDDSQKSQKSAGSVSKRGDIPKSDQHFKRRPAAARSTAGESKQKPSGVNSPSKLEKLDSALNIGETSLPVPRRRLGRKHSRPPTAESTVDEGDAVKSDEHVPSCQDLPSPQTNIRTSFSNPVILSSSPPMSSQEPARSVASVITHSGPFPDEKIAFDLSSSPLKLSSRSVKDVKQTGKSKKGVLEQSQSAAPPSPRVAITVPIESFFRPTKVLNASNLTQKFAGPASLRKDTISVPPKLSTGLKSNISRSKVAASRDSLPGTWREVIIDPTLVGGKMSPSSSSRSRVSCVDLTSD